LIGIVLLIPGIFELFVETKDKKLNNLIVPKEEINHPAFSRKRPLTSIMFHQYKLNINCDNKRDYTKFTEDEARLLATKQYAELGTILSNNLLTKDKYTFSSDRVHIVDRQTGSFLTSNPTVIGVLYEYETYIDLKNKYDNSVQF
jgi:hypothetical protein